MLVIIDKKIPEQAKDHLKDLGNVMELETKGITYEAISGHPDIFFCQLSKNNIVVAQNIPNIYIDVLRKHTINFVKGEVNVGNMYPYSAQYNAVVTDNYFIHYTRFTDQFILDRIKDKTIINTKQAYTRCNLLCLNDANFITSDAGLYKLLLALNIKVLFVSPEGIELSEFSHGFFGGVCGVYKDNIYIIGNLNYHKQGDEIRKFINDAGFKVVELYDGKLFDGGSVLFVEWN